MEIQFTGFQEKKYLSIVKAAQQNLDCLVNFDSLWKLYSQGVCELWADILNLTG